MKPLALVPTIATIGLGVLLARPVQPPLLVADRPLVSIGDPDGDEPDHLYGVVDALRLADGRIVIANCGSADIRFYLADGTHLRTVGRRGEGPGEFRFLRRLFPAAGDSIGAFDFLHQRIALLDSDGGVGRTINVPGPMEVIGQLKNGPFVAILRGWGETSVTNLPVGLFRWPDRIALLHADGTVMHSIRVRGAEVYVAPRDAALDSPYLRGLSIAVLLDRILVGSQDQPWLVEYDGALQRLRQLPTLTEPVPTTRAMRDQWNEASNNLIPLPDSLPAYGRFVAGTDGRIWVQDPPAPGRYPVTWTAYGDDVPLARAALPPRFVPTQFGPDWALGITQDTLNVERVTLLQLRPAASDQRRQIAPAEATLRPVVPGCLIAWP